MTQIRWDAASEDYEVVEAVAEFTIEASEMREVFGVGQWPERFQRPGKRAMVRLLTAIDREGDVLYAKYVSEDGKFFATIFND